jgi:hypothetical protein
MVLRFALANTKKQIQFCSIYNYKTQRGYTQILHSHSYKQLNINSVVNANLPV